MRLPLLVVLVLALVAGSAAADKHTSKAAKVSLDIPKGWQVTASDDLVRAASANNEIALVMLVVDSPEVKPALARLEQELYSSISGLRWVDKVKAVKVNKLKGTFVEGVGVSARNAQLDVLVLVAGPTPAKKGVIVLGVVEHDKLTANRPKIQSIFQSLKPTK